MIDTTTVVSLPIHQKFQTFGHFFWSSSFSHHCGKIKAWNNRATPKSYCATPFLRCAVIFQEKISGVHLPYSAVWKLIQCHTSCWYQSKPNATSKVRKLFLAIILKISFTLHKSKNSGSKQNRRETESVSSKQPYAWQLGYQKPWIPLGSPWNNGEITETTAYRTFTKNVVSRPLVSAFAQTWTSKACNSMIFYRIYKILESKINLKSQEMGYLTKGPFSLLLFFSI